MSDHRERTDRISAPDPSEGADAAQERHPSNADPAPSTTQWSRRRFGKTALGVTPVIATLYGRPLRAAANCTISGWVSGNTSNHHELGNCDGKSPENLQAESPELKPSSYGQRQDQSGGIGEGKGEASGKRHGILDKPLNSNHGFSGLHYRVDGKPATIRDALSAVQFDRCGPLERELIRYGTAALLNARFEPGYSLFREEQLVTEMVASSVMHGGYTTQSGDYLRSRQVLKFLQNTMGSPSWGG